jgi:hypothetical protein
MLTNYTEHLRTVWGTWGATENECMSCQWHEDFGGGAEHYKATCRLLRLSCSRLSMWLRETTQDCLNWCQIGTIKVKCTQHLESDHVKTVAYDGIHGFMRYQETQASCQFLDGGETVPVDFRCLALANLKRQQCQYMLYLHKSASYKHVNARLWTFINTA